MFVCQQCHHHDFELMVQPTATTAVTIRITDVGDVEIQAGSTRFIADLRFMNQFAACAGCGATKQWAYAKRLSDDDTIVPDEASA